MIFLDGIKEGENTELLASFLSSTQFLLSSRVCEEVRSTNPFSAEAVSSPFDFELFRNKNRVLTNFCFDRPRHVLTICFFFSKHVTGIYKNTFDRQLNTAQGFPVFKTSIEANYIFKEQDLFESFRLTDKDEKQIRQFAKDPRVGEKVRFFLVFISLLLPFFLVEPGSSHECRVLLLVVFLTGPDQNQAVETRVLVWDLKGTGR